MVTCWQWWESDHDHGCCTVRRLDGMAKHFVLTCDSSNSSEETVSSGCGWVLNLFTKYSIDFSLTGLFFRGCLPQRSLFGDFLSEIVYSLVTLPDARPIMSKLERCTGIEITPILTNLHRFHFHPYLPPKQFVPSPFRPCW